MTLEEFRVHFLTICGQAEEIVLHLNRIVDGTSRSTFGDAIFIYRESLKLRDDLYEVYHAVAKALSERENEGSAK